MKVKNLSRQKGVLDLAVHCQKTAVHQEQQQDESEEPEQTERRVGPGCALPKDQNKARAMLAAKLMHTALLLADLDVFCCVSRSTKWPFGVQECIASLSHTHARTDLLTHACTDTHNWTAC